MCKQENSPRLFNARVILCQKSNPFLNYIFNQGLTVVNLRFNMV